MRPPLRTLRGHTKSDRSEHDDSELAPSSARGVCGLYGCCSRSHLVWAAELPDADALMLRLMAMDNVPGAALALIKDANIVLEQGYRFRDLAAAAPVTTANPF